MVAVSLSFQYECHSLSDGIIVHLDLPIRRIVNSAGGTTF
jgi:hypothetical protein